MSPSTPKKAKRSRSPNEDPTPGSSDHVKVPVSSRHKKWSAEEEEAFDKYIYELGKAQLWKVVKDDPILKGRGANGIKSHWDAKWRKLRG